MDTRKKVLQYFPPRLCNAKVTATIFCPLLCTQWKLFYSVWIVNLFNPKTIVCRLQKLNLDLSTSNIGLNLIHVPSLCWPKSLRYMGLNLWLDWGYLTAYWRLSKIHEAEFELEVAIELLHHIQITTNFLLWSNPL